MVDGKTKNMNGVDKYVSAALVKKMLGLIQASIDDGDGYDQREWLDFLEQMPSAQETHDKRTETHARDYVDRDAVLDCFHDWMDQYGDVHTPDEMPEYRAIEALPTVDAVSVVRCKDCKHYGISETIAFGLPVKMCRYWGYEDMDDDEFCSRGEQKERDGNG